MTKRTVIEDRVLWTTTSLVKAGLVERPRPSAIVITDAGRTILTTVEGPIDRALLRARCPGYARWLADIGGELPEEERERSGALTVWMVRAGRGGAYAQIFVERSAVSVGWGATGDVSPLSHEDLLGLVAKRFPDATQNQRGQTVNTLYRLVHTIADGDLIVTPEPVSRTILLGWVAGPYEYMPEPDVGEHQHIRSMRWFARVARDELSYGRAGQSEQLDDPHEAEPRG